MGSPQWYGSTASSASDTTHTSRHTTPKRTVHRTLPPMEDTARPASAPANTLGLTTEAEAESDELLRRPLSELSKADVNARRRESKSKSPASVKSPLAAKSPLAGKSPLSTKSAVGKSPAPKTPKSECVHKTRSLKTTTPNPVPSYAAPTTASRASATPSVRRQAKPANPASPSKLAPRSPGKPAPVVRRRRNTLTKTPKSLRVR
jgi:hypothetical protein